MTYLRTIHTLDCDRHRPKSHIRFREYQLDSTHRMANAFFSDLLSTISERGRTLLRRGEPSVARQDASELLQLCKALLSGRGEAYAYAFEKPKVIRAAIDHAHVKPDAAIAGAREIAFFPPMTGG